MLLYDKYRIIILYRCFNLLLSHKLAYWFTCNSSWNGTVKASTVILGRYHIFFVLNKLYDSWIWQQNFYSAFRIHAVLQY